MIAFFQNKNVERIIEIILIIFGVFLIYQIIRSMLGGSWEVEDIIIGILLFNTGAVLTIGMIVAELKSDQKHLKDRVDKIEDQFRMNK